MPGNSATIYRDLDPNVASTEAYFNEVDLRRAPRISPSEVEALFHTLAQNWIQETGMLSNLKESYMNPNYQQIIGLGQDVVPVILRELKSQPNHWFWALRAITRENPAPPGTAGKTREIAQAWIRWGEENGYC
jgi:hypothetical protein